MPERNPNLPEIAVYRYERIIARNGASSDVLEITTRLEKEAYLIATKIALAHGIPNRKTHTPITKKKEGIIDVDTDYLVGTLLVKKKFPDIRHFYFEEAQTNTIYPYKHVIFEDRPVPRLVLAESSKKLIAKGLSSQ